MTTSANLESVLDSAVPGFACGKKDDSGLAQVRMNNLATDGRWDWTSIRRVPKHKAKPRHYLEPGDVLFNATNSPQLVGKSALYGGFPEPITFSNHFVRLRTNPNRLHSAYLTRWLNTLWQSGLFKTRCRQWVNQATFGKKELLALQIPLPPLPEQKRIVAILDVADDLRAKRRESLALLDKLVQSVFLDMFGDPSDHEWREVKLSEVCEEGAAITYGILQPGPELEDGIPYVRPSEIANGTIDLEKVRRTSPEIAARYGKSMLREHDILLSIVGTIGKVAVVPAELNGGNITQSSARIRIDPTVADPTFVRHFLVSPFATRQYDRDRLGAGVPRLNLHHVRDLIVPLPPLAKQQEFQKVALAIDVQKQLCSQHLAELDALFASLQARAFRGDL